MFHLLLRHPVVSLFVILVQDENALVAETLHGVVGKGPHAVLVTAGFAA